MVGDAERHFFPRPAPSVSNVSSLRKLKVPLESLEEACRGCAHLDGDEIGYPKGFDVDMDSEMLGSMNEYGRQVLVSTGKSDWIREVTDDDDSLAGLVKASYEQITSSSGSNTKLGNVLNKIAQKIKGAAAPLNEGELKGIYPSSAVVSELESDTLPKPTSNGVPKEVDQLPLGSPSQEGLPPSSQSKAQVPARLSILNSSFYNSSRDDDQQSVIVLPDYKIVHNVPKTRIGSEELVQSYLLASVGRTGLLSPSSPSTTLRSWPLPYHAVILLCSHKRRDKRCHIAAPLLISQFYHHLENHGLEVDERGDDLTEGDPIEDWHGSEGDKEKKLEEELKGVKKSNGGRVGVFKISHIGGHRYAGNVIIYLPNGTSIWYGRVTPQDVGAIVETTLMKGKVIPELLRGGLGLAGKEAGPAGVLSW